MERHALAASRPPLSRARAGRRRAPGRASRQGAYEEEQRRLEESRQDGVEAFSPFSTLPFGGLLEELMRGMGPSYRIDPDTGEWVEMTAE